jgi:hypothetical protein
MESILSEIAELHFPILLLTVLVIIYADHRGWQYFRGTREVLSPRFVTWSHRLVWGGLMGMVGTGVLLTIPVWEYYLTDVTFYVKMGFVGVLILNAFAIGSLAKVASERPFAALSANEQRTLMLSGALSALGWVSAATIGMFFL